MVDWRKIELPLPVNPQCVTECKYEEKICAAYMLLVTGDGQTVPMTERLRSLEKSMAETLPILKDLKDAALRQEGRDMERLDAEKIRDKSQARFRNIIVVLGILVSIIYSVFVINKQLKTQNFKLPTYFLDAPLPEFAKGVRIPRLSSDTLADKDEVHPNYPIH